MKIAFYMEDGLEQIVLTPDSKTEQAMLDKVHETGVRLSIYRGGFYYCAGGWHRQSADKNSTILVLRPPEKGMPEPPSETEFYQFPGAQVSQTKGDA